MKKILALWLVLLLAFASPSLASVGIKVDGTLKSTATDLNFKSAGTTISSDGSTATFNLQLFGGGSSGGTSMVTSDTAVSTSYSYIRKAIASNTSSPSYSAGTLADGYPGQMLTIHITIVTASGTFVLTPTTKTGFDALTFDAAKDEATLLFVNTTTGWILVSQTSVTYNNI